MNIAYCGRSAPRAMVVYLAWGLIGLPLLGLVMLALGWLTKATRGLKRALRRWDRRMARVAEQPLTREQLDAWYYASCSDE